MSFTPSKPENGIVIYGASDDLIEVDGTVTEEFSSFYDEDNLIAVSDGTLLRISFDPNGIWRIVVLARGAGELALHQCPGIWDDSAEDRYTDTLTITGDVSWVAHGKAFAKR